MLNKQTNKSNVLVNHRLSVGQEKNTVATKSMKAEEEVEVAHLE